MTPIQPSESPARRGSVQKSQPAAMPMGCQRTAVASAAPATASQPRPGHDAAGEQAERRGDEDGHERRHRRHVVEERGPRGEEPRDVQHDDDGRPPAAVRRTGAAAPARPPPTSDSGREPPEERVPDGDDAVVRRGALEVVPDRAVVDDPGGRERRVGVRRLEVEVEGHHLPVQLEEVGQRVPGEEVLACS